MISFVIPALKADEKYLYKCLESVVDEILRNGTGSDEIITIVKLEKSSEEDFQTRMMERYGEMVRCVFSEGNRSVARNDGLKAAKNKIITFLDSDTLIGDGFIPATMKDFERGYAYVNYSARPLDEEVADRRRLFFYSRFMNLNQRLYTRLGICRPYGFCASARKDYCADAAYGGEVFLEKLAGHGEDAEFGKRYGAYCNGFATGKYEKKIIVKTSFREWYKTGLWRSGVRMIINTWITPYLKRPTVKNWK